MKLIKKKYLFFGVFLILILLGGLTLNSISPKVNYERDSLGNNANPHYINIMRYSEPTNKDGSAIIWKDARQPPIKTLISLEEYNKIFKDYQEGLITQEQINKKLKLRELEGQKF